MTEPAEDAEQVLAGKIDLAVTLGNPFVSLPISAATELRAALVRGRELVTLLRKADEAVGDVITEERTVGPLEFAATAQILKALWKKVRILLAQPAAGEER